MGGFTVQVAIPLVNIQIMEMLGSVTAELETFNVTMWGSKMTTSGVGTGRADRTDPRQHEPPS